MNKTLIITLLITGLSASMYSYSENNKQTSTSNTTNTAQSHMDKGVKLWAEKKWDLAEIEFKKAVEKDPQSPQAHAKLAGLLLMQNKTAKAIPVYQQAITLDPKNAKLFTALSIAYLHQAKFAMAKAMADEALALNPKMEQVKKINEYIEMKQKMKATQPQQSKSELEKK